MSADRNGTARGVRIAVIDSGVHAAHPHVGSVAGGVAITEHGDHPDYTDRLGHGTAVTAVIREKAPDAELFAVRIFADRLTASVATLIRALDWAARSRMHLVNLSLGTTHPEHEAALRDALHRAAASGVCVVAARDDEGVRYFPGSIAHAAVAPVQLRVGVPAPDLLHRGRGWRHRLSGLRLAPADPRRAAGAQPQRHQLRGRERDRDPRSPSGRCVRRFRFAHPSDVGSQAFTAQ